MKKTMKKLTLDAQTVRVLNPVEMANVVGGKTTAITCTCPTTDTFACVAAKTTAMRCTTGG